MNSSASFTLLVARSLQRSGLMLVRSDVELAYKLGIVLVGRTTIVYSLRKVVDVVADHCMIKDRVDHCSS